MEILGCHERRSGCLAIRLLAISLFLTRVFAQSADEYEVKAAFLYNFIKFVEWPQIPDPDAFNLCVLGDDPFDGALDRLVKGKSAYNRKIQVRRLKDPVETKQCQIVFVRGREESKAVKLIDTVRGMPVLTVSEEQRFTGMGGIMFLKRSSGHIGVGINAQAAQAAGLQISAKLMALANRFENESEAR